MKGNASKRKAMSYGRMSIQFPWIGPLSGRMGSGVLDAQPVEAVQVR
jgi:hypothetical protein